MCVIKIAICDDERFYVDKLKQFIEVYSNEADVELEITTYNDGRELIEDVKEDAGRYNIVFLDVEMPQISGIDTAMELRKLDSKLIIFFVTSHEQFALSAYKVDALGYIVKPVSYTELKHQLARAVVMVHFEQNYSEAESRYLEVQVAKNTRIVDVRNIQYIEKRRNQCVLHCIDSEITCYESLKGIHERLDSNKFIYTHQGFIVNFDRIKEVRENCVCLGDGKEIPISRNHYKTVRERHMNKLHRLLQERRSQEAI